jgi:hypothetical protein
MSLDNQFVKRVFKALPYGVNATCKARRSYELGLRFSSLLFSMNSRSPVMIEPSKANADAIWVGVCTVFPQA